MTIKRTLPAICASVAGLWALTAPEPVAAASSPPLAAGVQPASDFSPTHTAYVVTNATPLYRSPAYGSDNTTGDTLERGARPQVLGEANAGLYLLVGRAGQGVASATRRGACFARSICVQMSGRGRQRPNRSRCDGEP